MLIRFLAIWRLELEIIAIGIGNSPYVIRKCLTKEIRTGNNESGEIRNDTTSYLMITFYDRLRTVDILWFTGAIP